VHINLTEGSQGGGDAVQFILKAQAFFLELANDRLHQRFWHPAMLSLALLHQDTKKRMEVPSFGSGLQLEPG